MDDLRSKISSKQARLGVVGLGYVGLPLALEFHRAGFRVDGIERDLEKVSKIQAGESYLPDVQGEKLKKALNSCRFKVHNDYEVVKELDCVSICVPTPLRKTRDPDISYILSAAKSIADFVHPEMLIVLESTTYPGTTEEILVQTLANGELKLGENLCIAFSPERVDPGNPVYDTHNTPKVVGGVTPHCTAMAKLLYEQAVESVVPVSSAAVAEMVKLLENTFRAVNIALVNEVAMMCNKLGISIWEVIEAAASKPFGFMPFYPGPGLGGHCIPIDPLYLSWKLKMLNYNARFIELASEVNTHMPDYCVERIRQVLNDHSKCVRGSHILVLGVSYKRDTGDTRESPALEIIRLLEEDGADIEYCDPFVAELRTNGIVRKSARISPETLKDYDLVILLTDHSCFDYEMIQRHARVVFDSRNGFKMSSENVIRL